MENRPSAALLAEVWRGDFLESQHHGHAVIVDGSGDIVAAWGDPDAVILPRSSAKMIQALPLVASGAADALTPRHLALACASHEGSPIHTHFVARWLSELGLGESDLLCGPQPPRDADANAMLIRSREEPNQIHNNCSGKHTGFLALGKHLGAGPSYIAAEHPVQRAVLEVFEETTGSTSSGYAIDGCSAPNFATSLVAFARALAWFATAGSRSAVLDQSAVRLREAMIAHPELVAGEGGACTHLMRAMRGVAVKTGAEGVYAGILPEAGLGIALKVADGATRASEAAIAALLVRMGVLNAEHPTARALLMAPQVNRAGRTVGYVRPSPGLLA